MSLPSQNASQDRGIETFRMRKPSSHFVHCHFVLLRGREEGETTRHQAEHVRASRGVAMSSGSAHSTNTAVDYVWLL